MKSIVSDVKTLIVALIGFIGGGVWAYKSDWEIEPIVLMCVSFVQILAYIVIGHTKQNDTETTSGAQNITNNAEVKKQVNVQNNNGKIEL